MRGAAIDHGNGLRDADKLRWRECVDTPRNAVFFQARVRKAPGAIQFFIGKAQAKLHEPAVQPLTLALFFVVVVVSVGAIAVSLCLEGLGRRRLDAFGPNNKQPMIEHHGANTVGGRIGAKRQVDGLPVCPGQGRRCLGLDAGAFGQVKGAPVVELIGGGFADEVIGAGIPLFDVAIDVTIERLNVGDFFEP